MTYDQAVSLLALLGLEIYAQDARQIELREALETIWRQQSDARPAKPKRLWEARSVFREVVKHRPRAAATRSGVSWLWRNGRYSDLAGCVLRLAVGRPPHRLPRRATHHTSHSKNSTDQAARQIAMFCEAAASA